MYVCMCMAACINVIMYVMAITGNNMYVCMYGNNMYNMYVCMYVYVCM
jgi:hypothetical protein